MTTPPKRSAKEFVTSILEVFHAEAAAQKDCLSQAYLRSAAHKDMDEFVFAEDPEIAEKNYCALAKALSDSDVITRDDDPADIWWHLNTIRSRLDRERNVLLRQ